MLHITLRGRRCIAAVCCSRLKSLVLRFQVHGEEAKCIESVLNIHSIAQPGASSLLFPAHDAALAIAYSVQLGYRRILKFTLVLRVVFGIGLIIIIIFLFLLRLITLAVGDIVISLGQSLTLTFASSQISVLLFFAIGQHDNIAFEFSIFLDCFQQLSISLN